MAAGSLRGTLFETDEPLPPKEKSEQQAFDALSGGLEKMVTALKGQLTDRDVATRRAAVDVLESLGEEGFSAADAITQALRDPDIYVRWAAAQRSANWRKWKRIRSLATGKPRRRFREPRTSYETKI